MLASETLAKNRPAECNPANIKKASSTKVLNTAAPKATTPPVDDGEYCMEGDEDCVCEDEEETNDDECKEGDPDCVCEEEGEETSSSKPPAPPKSSSKPKAAATSTTKAVKSTQAPTDSGKARTGGVATYFWQNGNAGACGTKHQDTDFIAAIDKDLYGPDNKASQYCGRKILITRTDTGKTVTVTVADDCEFPTYLIAYKMPMIFLQVRRASTPTQSIYPTLLSMPLPQMKRDKYPVSALSCMTMFMMC